MARRKETNEKYKKNHERMECWMLDSWKEKYSKTEKTHKLLQFHLPFREKSAFAHLSLWNNLKKYFHESFSIALNYKHIAWHLTLFILSNLILFYSWFESQAFFRCLVFSSSFFDFASKAVHFVVVNHVKVFNFFFLRMDKTTITTATKNNVNYWVFRPYFVFDAIYIYLEPFIYCELNFFFLKYTMIKLVLWMNPFDAFIQIDFKSWFLRSAEIHLQLAIAFSFFVASKIVTNNSEIRHRDASCRMPVLYFHLGISLI